MTKELLSDFEREIRMAYIHGFGNGQDMERGLGRDNTEEYVSGVMIHIRKKYNLETNSNTELQTK